MSIHGQYNSLESSGHMRVRKSTARFSYIRTETSLVLTSGLYPFKLNTSLHCRCRILSRPPSLLKSIMSCIRQFLALFPHVQHGLSHQQHHLTPFQLHLITRHIAVIMLPATLPSNTRH